MTFERGRRRSPCSMMQVEADRYVQLRLGSVQTKTTPEDSGHAHVHSNTIVRHKPMQEEADRYVHLGLALLRPNKA